MKEFVESLPDGWTIYLWMIFAAGILIAAGFMLRCAAKNAQFHEDIKYTVFNEDDKDKMDPEEYKKSREVIAHQTQLRNEYLEKKAETHAAKHAGR